jgi:quinoprotein glucose dehydrogenase
MRIKDLKRGVPSPTSWLLRSLASAAFAIGLSAATSANAQAARNAAEGVYTKAQAARGQAAYLDNCALCHGDHLLGAEGSPPLTGSPFLKKWGGKPLAGLFNFINTQMPPGQPGALGARTNADIVAFMLSVGELPAGDSELPTDNTKLNAIILKGK